MPSDLVFDVFFMYFHTLNHKKSQKLVYLMDFWKYWRKIGHFFAKNGPKIFKSRYLRNTFFRTSFLCRCYKHEIWPSYREKWSKKTFSDHFFKILSKSLLLGQKWQKNAKFGNFSPKKWTFWQNFEKVINKSFLDHFSL